MKSFSEINEIHMDVLREIGNIGSGNAAMALSQMLGQTINIAIPEIGISDYYDAYEKLGGVETVMVGILLTLSDDLQGMMMLLLPCDVACDLLTTMMGMEINDYTEIDEIGFSAISEVANIMSASFVKAIAEMTGLYINISPPSATIDMLGSIMSVPAIYFAQISDKLMFMKNEMEISGKRTPANIILLPDMESLDKLMTSLGIEI